MAGIHFITDPLKLRLELVNLALALLVGPPVKSQLPQDRCEQLVFGKMRGVVDWRVDELSQGVKLAPRKRWYLLSLQL